MARTQLQLTSKPESSSNLATKFTPHNRIALGLVAVGALLRLIGLGARPLWFDEVISAVYARQDFSTLVALNSGDNHPVGYYLTLKYWMALFGDSETAIRLLSVGPGVASLWLVWLIGRRLFPTEPWLAMTALALAVFSPFQIYFSQEARNYAPLEFFSLAAVWFGLRAFESNRWRDWVGLGLCGALGLVCNLTMAFYLAALGLYPLFRAKHYWQKGVITRLFVTGLGAGLLSGLALLPKLTNRLYVIKDNFWIPAPNPLLVLRTFYSFIFGASEIDRFVPAFALALLILLFSLVPAIIACLRRPQSSNLAGLPLTLWLLFGPIGLIIVVSLLFQPLYLDKALIGCAPFYYLLVAWAIFRPDLKRVPVSRKVIAALPLIASLLLAVSSLPNLYDGTIAPAYIARYDAARINDYLRQNSQPGDVVASATDISWLPLVYYGPNEFPPKYPIKEYPYPNIFPLLLEKLNSATIGKDEFASKLGARRLWVVFEVQGKEAEFRAAPRPADLSGEINWFHSNDWQKDLLAHYDGQYQRLQAVALDRVILVLYKLKD